MRWAWPLSFQTGYGDDRTFRLVDGALLAVSAGRPALGSRVDRASGLARLPARVEVSHSAERDLAQALAVRPPAFEARRRGQLGEPASVHVDDADLGVAVSAVRPPPPGRTLKMSSIVFVEVQWVKTMRPLRPSNAAEAELGTRTTAASPAATAAAAVACRRRLRMDIKVTSPLYQRNDGTSLCRRASSSHNGIDQS